ncbi:sigma-70 family RNA polymerase sigma factor [Stieleria sp. ICT_E10.1]|uniref:RNA polymerase sigma factor n=1 Tax=Stieleria sedimenti TaxID=2976331 RepID=UPI0021808FAF|nr:sigma-70 family RNA polymerase sigma factor [Stieleria sedimenti]MCS7468465.1 sigma-70 family RNA polymerase sigma factor [Stieleria sedimenti]
MSVPETRPSLLMRIRDPRDRQAWSEFSDLYRPVVCRMARHRGMQPADADDLAQQVLMAISRAIEGFTPDHGQAKFRTWLKTIARRAIINALTRNAPDRAIGGSDVIDLLHQQPAADEQTQTLMMQYRREIFLVAASQIREEFQDETWQAFWSSVVLGQDVQRVAESLNRSRGSVYTARSRVMKRLKDKVQELDLRQEHDES